MQKDLMEFVCSFRQ